MEKIISANRITVLNTIQSQKTEGFCVADFATLSDERRSRSKIFPLFIWIKEPCVRKFEGLEHSKLLGISQTKLTHAHAAVEWNTDHYFIAQFVTLSSTCVFPYCLWYSLRQKQLWDGFRWSFANSHNGYKTTGECKVWTFYQRAAKFRMYCHLSWV